MMDGKSGMSRFRDQVIAVVPTPLDRSGQVHREGLRRMVEALALTELGGIAAATSLGRGSRLSVDQRAVVLQDWREGLGSSRLLVTSVSGLPESRRPAQIVEEAVVMAREARLLGVDLLVIEPPGAFRGRADRDRLILEYHAEVMAVGLPCLISFRREVAGGIIYGAEVLAQLLARPEAVGVEVATLDGIALFQQVEALTRELAPGKLIVSGEDRFLGYSLMSGADAVLTGLGSIDPARVIGLMKAYRSGDAHRFLDVSRESDEQARAIFAAPVEGIPLRMLLALVQAKLVPDEAAHDPWGLIPRPSRPV